jgi:signal transduction histidine kinase
MNAAEGAGTGVPAIRRTLQQQSTLALLLVLVIAGVGLSWYLRHLLCASYDDALLEQTRVLSAFVSEELGEKAEVDLSEVKLPDFQPGPDAQYFELWVVPDRRAARSASLGDEHLSRVLLAADSPGLWDLRLPDGRAGRALAIRLPVPPLRRHRKAPLPSPDPGLPRPLWANLVVARERASLDQALRRLALALAALGAGLLVLVPFVVARVARRALRPLDQFADVVAGIDAQSLSGRVSDPGLVPEELRPIAAKLNDLLGRLHASFERERRFSADVAHELRTPLAELRAIAEVALRFPPDAHDRPGVFEDVRDAAVQMERLVSSLRTLAACEGGAQIVATAPVDVGLLAERTWARFAAAATAKSLSVRGDSPAGVVVQSDPVLLESILSNLFSNAIEYAPRGGTVEWNVAVTNGQATVSISNTNADLRSEDMPHVFEAFWRRDAARTGGVHSGLGLSLSQAFATLLAARLTLVLEAPGRVRAQLRLPAA